MEAVMRAASRTCSASFAMYTLSADIVRVCGGGAQILRWTIDRVGMG